jgi:hypothetical protein
VRGQIPQERVAGDSQFDLAVRGVLLPGLFPLAEMSVVPPHCLTHRHIVPGAWFYTGGFITRLAAGSFFQKNCDLKQLLT